MCGLRKKLLCIDKDVKIVNSLTSRIKKEGSEVVKVQSLAKGADLVQREEYGLILLELIYKNDSWTEMYANNHYLSVIPFLNYIKTNEASKNKMTPIGILSKVDIHDNSKLREFERQVIINNINFYLKKSETRPGDLYIRAKPFLI